MNHDTPAIDRRHQREIYDLLVNKNPYGLSRKGLVAQVSGGDRVVRNHMEAVKILAAEVPHRTKGPQIIGFDPKVGMYVSAQDAEQAARVVEYVHSRVKAHIAVLQAQLTAFEDRFGHPAPSAQEMQASMFAATQLEAS